MLRPIFWVLLPLALLGDARMFLFVANRLVFGAHKEEKSPFHFLLYTVPPLLLALTLLLYPLHRAVEWLASNRMVDRMTPELVERLNWSMTVAQVGGAWLLLAAGIGTYWLLERTHAYIRGTPRVAGTQTHAPELVKLRKAHVPFAWLRNLGAHNDIYDLEVTRHDVFIDDLPPEFDGYRIAFITDTHVASFMRRELYRQVVARATAFDPDIILLGGDFVTWERHIPLMTEVLVNGLEARDGVYAVLGNHDYWANADAIVATMTARGVRFVINRSIVLRRGEATLPLVGIDEIYRGKPDMNAAFAGVDETKPVIGITHHPDLFDDLGDRRLDLLVCGHTHGGQIRFPFFGSIVVPSKHEGRYASGFHRAGRVLMYVSRGIGAIPPLRILCRPEVATFVLRRNAR
jgi:predicted MPP superfamily phosphohydrolase